MSHAVAPSAPTTYTVSFTTQYQLTMSAGTGGSVTPASGGFYDSGQRVAIDAAAGAGYRFSAWTGTGSGSVLRLDRTYDRDDERADHAVGGIRG